MRIACIGGGHGLAMALRAARRLTTEVTGIVNVVDDGGSSGRLVSERGGLPPGDLRRCIGALAEPGSPWGDLLEHRFSGNGWLGGHALGNLVLAALEERSGGLARAALDLSALVGGTGTVIPVSETPHLLVAETAVGTVRGQAAINESPGISKLWLEPDDPPAVKEAVEAITGADVVVMGPGSLFTSVIPPLLVPAIARAVAGTTAIRVFAANLAPQVAETRHLDLAGHVDAFVDHGGCADVIVYDPWSELGDASGIAIPTVGEAMEATAEPGGSGVHDPDRFAAALNAAIRSAHRSDAVREGQDL